MDIKVKINQRQYTVSLEELAKMTAKWIPEMGTMEVVPAQ